MYMLEKMPLEEAVCVEVGPVEVKVSLSGSAVPK
jgi:hypothetical protein